MSKCNRFLFFLASPPRRPKGDEWPFAVRCANRGVSVLVVHQRPTDRLAPETTGNRIPRLEHNGSNEISRCQEVSAHHHAEFVALGIGKHDMVRVLGLPDIRAHCAQRYQSINHLGLMLDRFAHEIQMDAVLTDLRLRDWHELKNETSSIRRYEADLIARLVVDRPIQSSRPKTSKSQRIVGIEAEAHQPSCHASSVSPDRLLLCRSHDVIQRYRESIRELRSPAPRTLFFSILKWSPGVGNEEALGSHQQVIAQFA